jgi:mycothiol system anti-sigma-R factor
MNCEEAVEKLWQFLDKELEGAASTELQQHLEECRHCFSKVEFEERLRAMLRRSCCSEQAPPELRERLSKILRLF